MLIPQANAKHFHRHQTWSKYLDSMHAESLSLVGFEGSDLWKIYDALEACSNYKDIQTVEVFIHSFDNFFDGEFQVAPGLCLVRVPDSDQLPEYRDALQALSCVIECRNVTVVPVLRPLPPQCNSLKAIKDSAPFYLNMDSEQKDFVSMFNAYLFTQSRVKCPSAVLKERSPKKVTGTAQLQVLDYV